MKAILMSIRPEWVAKILNGEKTIEIRKKFSKDYVGWVYIYVTKGKGYCYHAFESDANAIENTRFIPMTKCNGKVVARFWCDKVEEINKITMYGKPFNLFETETLQPNELLKQSCLSAEEMTKYFMFSNLPKESAVIHITKLEIFDKPKEISEFMKTLDSFNGLDCFRCSKHRNCSFNRDKKCEKLKLTRAPQSWCWIEV